MKYFTGWKTYAAAIIALLVGLNHVYHWVPQETEDVIIAFAAALGLVGIRHAIGINTGIANSTKTDVTEVKVTVAEVQDTVEGKAVENR